MVFLLPGDIVAYGGNVRLRNGECAIASLPGERRKLRALSLNPFGRRLLDFFHSFADRDGSTELEENVNMILDRIDEDGRTAQVLENSGHVSVQRIANAVPEDAFAVLGAEDKVNVQPCEGLWH